MPLKTEVIQIGDWKHIRSVYQARPGFTEEMSPLLPSSFQDAGVFQQEFDQLLAFLQSHTIETELLEVGVCQVALLIGS